MLRDKFLTKLQDCLSNQLLQEQIIQDKKASKSYIQGIIEAIVANLKISIQNIHVCFEDADVGCAAGLTIKSITIDTVDEKGNPIFQKDDMMILHKMLNIEGISVYCNSYYIPLVQADQAVRFLYLKETIAAQNKPHPDLNYIICPMTLRAQLTMDRHDPDKIKESQFKVLTDISSLKLNISSSQITILLRTVNKFLSFGSRQSHVEFRPTSEHAEPI